MSDSVQSAVPSGAYVWVENGSGDARVHAVQEQGAERTICGRTLPEDAKVEPRGSRSISCPDCIAIVGKDR